MSAASGQMGRRRALVVALLLIYGAAFIVLVLGSFGSSPPSGGVTLARGWTLRSAVLPVAPGWLGAVLVARNGGMDSPWPALAGGLAVSAALALWTAAAVRRGRTDAVALGVACSALQAFLASVFVG